MNFKVLNILSFFILISCSSSHELPSKIIENKELESESIVSYENKNSPIKKIKGFLTPTTMPEPNPTPKPNLNSTSAASPLTTETLKTTPPKIIVNLNEEASLIIGNEWGGETIIFPVDDEEECIKRSEFNADKISAAAKYNLEFITKMNISKITTIDLSEVTWLDAESLVSYDGLEYLTCLQWLSFGNKYLPKSRDFRFLESFKEMRYLDLSSTEFKDVELLKPLNKLEVIVLPFGFKSISDLASLKSLKRINAPAARTCSIESVMNMPNLEELYLGGRNSSGAASYHQSMELSKLDRNFNISFSPDNNYLQLVIDGGPQAFNPEPFTPESQDSYQNPLYVMDVIQSIYDLVEDDYDVIVFVGNAEDSTASYAGQATQISNNIEGLGDPIWSTADCHGSKGRLRGSITLPSIKSLWHKDLGSGNTLNHEMLHLWGGGDLLPDTENFEGELITGHWGISSANGLLGGFKADELEVIDNGVYRANYFNDSGGNNDQPFSPLELYIMGVLPASEVPDTVVFSGVSKLNDSNTCEDYGYEWWMSTCFRASKKRLVNIQEVIDLVGERPYEEELEISMLVVAVSEEALTESEWTRLDKHISRYADTKPRDDLCKEYYKICHNMWSASGGKIRINLNQNK